MIIVQERWNAADAGQLALVLQAACAGELPGSETLVLLPLADGGGEDGEAACLRRIGAAAAAAGAIVAGAIRYASGTVGFLVGRDGVPLLRAPKILPDLAEGLSDTAAALGVPADFAIARLALGQVAVLVGEDATAAHLVRAAMWRGAEIVLNPSREFTDDQFGLRQQARMARAYENHLCLATASPSTLTRAGGFEERLPPASAVYDEWALPVRASGAESFLRVALDVEAVRRRRAEYFGNLCVSTRPTVYSPGYRAALAARPAAASSPATRDGWRAEGARRAQAHRDAYPVRADAIERYDILLGQVTPRHVVDASSAAQVITRNVDHALDLVGRFAAAPDTRLVVFPEFFLQGSRLGRLPGLFPVAGINLRSSPHIERLARFAQQHNVHLCGAVLEIDDDWPGHLFNTAFILDDRGELIHRYRKIQCADVFGFMDTTPGSILDRYVDRYGYEALFPVADTRLGRLATAICFDMNFPELHRALALRGAEVLLHPTAEPHNIRRRAWENGRQVRAWENTMYVASAGLGGEYWEPDGELSLFSRGHSKVVNFDGSVQSVADGPGPVPLGGQIDLRALREARADGLQGLLAWDEPAVYAGVYASTVTIPDNLMRGPDDRPYAGGRALNEAIARLTAAGVFVAPSAASRPGATAASGTLAAAGM
jgi:deaminated glutathione amidase